MSLRVLGVDPGLTRCGLGVVEVEGNRRATLVAVGVVGTVAGTALDARLLVISEAIELWLDTHRPDVLAVERVFSQLNVSTVMGTAQASGVVIAAAARRGIPVALHTPTEVKAAVTGSGSANKDAVGKMVTKILRLDEMPKPADAADALALAITHAWRRGVAGPGPTAGSASRGTAPNTGMTAAQRLWAEAEARAKRGSY
ncbi:MULTISPECIES: crossover junction endodeoxyribonuclease RuvC [unclassified Arthrobacter]|uniref:crossover junction endodeoxyribonuclease RuvC n=1 Tax=unclassified Arthrobacter TaxID=235627 RepID=UPI001D14B7D8|nr:MULTISPECIES: crossover junction endodeoxyribonuclease RuvC [unclassified Arthrobacter]MCC3279129.1 crossover junction endodeoxyribonuclease RuvC [Arthrobacter sp. zg-Y40]MCC9177506.1 crossover junction endodeoxyribonuclease RuvC [Arthrobacter sp. zg-Y750]MCC3274900.1 crossover junction endodeoxyribonuclease RuvC [Arthrobacter sp. zg-Y20]MDK1315056.1 crossover junction endodeoxyribonuclease RuvC [Arthrobacter sp. zg.Y20]MDK1327918.1 crossover junction endodeoxyribonuclease RuvC [Arthrobacte